MEEVAYAFRLSENQDIKFFLSSVLEENYSFIGKHGVELGNSSVKLFVAFYKNLPLDLKDDIYLPIEASNIIHNNILLDDKRSAYLDSHTLDIDLLINPVVQVTTETINDDILDVHSEVEDGVIKGKTNFQGVLNLGVTQTEIELVLELPMPNPLTLIRGFCLEKGLEFSVIRDGLQSRVDAFYQKQI
jgi:hypothetical protein